MSFYFPIPIVFVIGLVIPLRDVAKGQTCFGLLEQLSPSALTYHSSTSKVPLLFSPFQRHSSRCFFVTRSFADRDPYFRYLDCKVVRSWPLTHCRIAYISLPSPSSSTAASTTRVPGSLVVLVSIFSNYQQIQNH